MGIYKSVDGAVIRAVQGQRLYSRRLIALVAALGLLAALGVVGGTVASVIAARQQALDSTAHDTRILTHTVTDAVSRTVQSVDITLASVADFLRERDYPDEVEPILRDRLAFSPHLRQIVVTDPRGVILHDSSGRARGRSMDVSAIVAEHQRVAAPLAITPVVPQRLFGLGRAGEAQGMVPMSRAIRDGNGEIRQLIVAGVNAEYFLSIFFSLDLGEGSQVRLWRFDGTLLAAEGTGLDIRPGAFAGDALFQRLKEAEFGTYHAAGPDTKRITSYRTALAWPLVMSVSVPTKVALRQWRENTRTIATVVGAVVVLLLGLTAILVVVLIRRARDEAALHLSDRTLAAISNGVCIADAREPDTPLVYVNAAFERITGYGADQVLGRNARVLHDGLGDQPGLEQLRNAMAAAEPVTVVLRNRRADGSLFWNELSVMAVRDHLGRATHYVGIQRDITEQEESRTQLNEAYSRIERYSAELERFSFILAHHLREPARQMNVQGTLLRQMLAGRNDEEVAKCLDFITEAGGRLMDLLRGVQLYLALDRFTIAGRRAQGEQCFDRAAAQAFGGAPPFAIDRQPLPDLGIESKRLVDLFAALLDNAWKYRHPDRPLEVRVAWRELDGMIEITLADNGQGIAERYHKRVFDVFERLHTRDAVPGTGIGLAIARKTVEMAGGTIRVESDGESGSTFRFTLPKA